MEGTDFTTIPLGDQQQIRWSRAQQADYLRQFDTLTAGMSQREISKKMDVPRSTLADWDRRRSSHSVPDSTARFLESPDGLSFLHELVTALHLVFQQVGSSGVRPICEFLRLTNLDSFVASSYGSQYLHCLEVQKALSEFGEEEKARLGAEMECQEITICEDETFHPQICLVAMEPVSGFIIVEAYARNREADTWTRVVDTALDCLNVKVIQSTSDEARPLIKHAQEGLGADHSPDLFHVQKDLHRAFSNTLNTAIVQAKKKVKPIKAEMDRIEKKRAEYLPLCDDPEALSESYDREIRAAEIRKENVEKEAERFVEQRDRALEDMRTLSDVYHPFDLQAGVLQDEESVKEKLNAGFDTMEDWASRLSLSGWAQGKIAKARKVLPLMVATIAFFWAKVSQRFDELDFLTEVDKDPIIRNLVGGLYLQQAARKARNAEERKRIQAVSEQLMQKADEGPVGHLTETQREQVLKTATWCANLFQRSSSCVEGRNSQLALRHHSLHNLSNLKLSALTTVHNYFITRADGSTAAERFFGIKPRDVFSTLLAKLPKPGRPKRRAK